jgi:hypothetical protein
MSEEKYSKRFLKEPLFHFIVLAGLLFVANYLLSATQKVKIVVDRQSAEFLIQQREDLELRTLSAAERSEVIESYIEDEILYSEAYKRGLDRGDSRMRRNMILKMRGLLTGEIENPTEQVLRAYFEINRDKFTVPASINIDHVYYRSKGDVADGQLQRLRSGANHLEVGEFDFNMPRLMPRMTQQYLVGTFGPEVAKSILAIQDGQWHGPFESIHGVHFIRVNSRTPAQLKSYEGVQRYLEDYWVLDRGRQRIEDEVARLRDNYEVIVEDHGMSVQ